MNDDFVREVIQLCNFWGKSKQDLAELLDQAAEEQFATLSLNGGTGPPSRAQSLYREAGGSVGSSSTTAEGTNALVGLIPTTNGTTNVSAMPTTFDGQQPHQLILQQQLFSAANGGRGGFVMPNALIGGTQQNGNSASVVADEDDGQPRQKLSTGMMTDEPILPPTTTITTMKHF